MSVRALLGAMLALLAGCVTYEPKPLDPDHILDQERERRIAAGPAVSLEAAAARLREHNPDVREARAALELAKGVADVKTPMPNPSVDVVPTYLPGDVLGASRWGVDAGFGWSIPLSGRLRLNDELNKFIAEQAVVNAVATEREQYLALRGEYASLAQAQKALRA